MFDGNGNWTSDFSAQADRDNGIKILASRFDNIFIADIKESFENCLTKDGQIAPIGNFNMGGQKITNLNTGVNDNDAVNMSQLNTKVSLTGNETISGTKTFNSIIYSSVNGRILVKKKEDGKVAGSFEVHEDGNNTGTSIFAFDKNETTAAVVSVRYNNGNSYATAPASDISGSIVTTIGIKKTQDCYVKLGNGLILQWGTFGSSNYERHTVTLPTPFSDTNYVVVATQQRTQTNDFAANWHVLSKATTSFSIQGQSSSMNWLAIGY